jgi:hypothetical protein
MADDPGQAIPKKGSRKGHRRQIPWRRDSVIMARLPQVERLHLAGRLNTQIAEALHVDEATIRLDLKRLQELWLERIGQAQEAMRAEKVAELADIKSRALHQAEWDEFCERAVLFDDPTMPDHEMARYGLDTELRVSRDEKGSATFRGQKAQSLSVARQAVMDQAKVLGLVIDKQELSGANGGAVPIRIVEVIPPDGGDGGNAPD